MKALKQYAYKGITDECTDCFCCGRADLKATVILEDRISGALTYFGRTCAARALGWTVKTLDTSIATTKAQAKKESEVRKNAHESAVLAHPLMQARNEEIAAFWQQVPRPAFKDAPIAKWAAMEAQARKEVEGL